MGNSILAVGLVVAGLILIVNASSFAGPPRSRSQMVQLPRWAYVALGVTMAVLGAIALVTSL